MAKPPSVDSAPRGSTRTRARGDAADTTTYRTQYTTSVPTGARRPRWVRRLARFLHHWRRRLALAVAAGESPVSALDRVVRRSGGELSRDLGRVLAAIRTGAPVAEAFDELARTTGLPIVARFADGVAVAIERGTPLADVLHAQAAAERALS